MRPALPVLLAATLWSCADEPGACEEVRVVSSVRTGFCAQLDSPANCPVEASGDGSGEYVWEWHDGGKCPDLGYPFDCGDGVFVDLESLCGEAGGT